MQSCLITLRSPTYSMKAQKILSENGIQAKTVKLGGDYLMRGCTHGIRLDCKDQRRAAQLLRENAIPFSDIRNT